MGRKQKRPRLTGPIHGRIAKLREQNELTQDDLAKEIGVDKTAVSHWENGVSRPSLDKLLKLAAFFDVSIDELTEGERAA